MGSKSAKKSRKHGIYSRSDRMVHNVMLVTLLLLSAACLYPFLIILSTSFQTQENLYENGYRVLAPEYTLTTYKLIFTDAWQLLNSYKITILSTVLTTVLGVLMMSGCGYVMSRADYAYKKILSMYVFFTMLFHGGLVPSYILISRWLGLKNTIWALVLPLCVSSWNIMLMKGYFGSIPTSLIESAKLDGASELRIFTSIVIPLSKPAFATISLFMVLGSWNDYMQTLLYIDESKLEKLQYLLMKILKNVEFLNSPEAQQYGSVIGMQSVPTLTMRMAMCVLAAGPIVIVFPFFQKYFAKGLTVGSLKE